jgi:hypothetical protein
MIRIHKYHRILLKNISNIPGWKTKEKIVIFLVDDWGSIRIRDKCSRDYIQKISPYVESNRFNKFDTLESDKDLSALFEILFKHKDNTGKSASFTALSVVANPDFEKIESSDFLEYFHESILDTFNHYYGNNSIQNLYFQGIKEGIFIPQFHGREHFNCNFWLKELQSGDKILREAFNTRSIGMQQNIKGGYNRDYMAAFDFKDKAEIKNHSLICQEGIKLFQKIFLFNPSLFTSPSLIHHHELENYLLQDNIMFIDRAKQTKEPIGNGNYHNKYYSLGQKNSDGQIYITRNCLFEPNEFPDQNIVDQTLRDMEIAFRWGKPAIISSHRVNFVGGIEVKNRDNGLKALAELLKQILKNWPDIRFLTFNQFANLISP